METLQNRYNLSTLYSCLVWTIVEMQRFNLKGCRDKIPINVILGEEGTEPARSGLAESQCQRPAGKSEFLGDFLLQSGDSALRV